MNWKLLSIISFLLIIPVIIIWIVHSSDYGEILVFSRDSKINKEKVFDDLLGTETIKANEEEGFWLGLLPPDDTVSLKAAAGVVPLSGILLFLGFLSIYMNYRKKKK